MTTPPLLESNGGVVFSRSSSPLRLFFSLTVCPWFKRNVLGSSELSGYDQ